MNLIYLLYQERFIKKIEYGVLSTHPEIVEMLKVPKVANAIWKKITTKHEGDVFCFKFWNFWVRAGVKADLERTNTELIYKKVVQVKEM